MTQRDISDVLNGIWGVISGFDHPGFSDFSRKEIHSLWFVMWFEPPESTYQTSSNFKSDIAIQLALCFITRVSPDPALSEPPTKCDC